MKKIIKIEAGSRNPEARSQKPESRIQKVEGRNQNRKIINLMFLLFFYSDS